MFITLPSFSHFSDLQSHHTHSIDFESFFTCPKKVSRLSQKCKGKKVSPTEMEFNTRTPSPLWINWQDLLHSFRNIPAFVDLLRRPLEHAKFQKGNDARFFFRILNGVKRFAQWSKSKFLYLNTFWCNWIHFWFHWIHIYVVQYILM